MVNKTKKIVFARVNRRRPSQDTIAMRPFSVDMSELAESRLTTFHEKAKSQRTGRTWFAADMTLDASGDFLTATLGFSVREERRTFDEDAWSWIKGETQLSDTGSEATVVPFAVDLRESQRWVAFATSARIQPSTFCVGLEKVLNQAVVDAGMVPTEWEVDLVVARARVDQWLTENPFVHLIRRTIKFSNPGRDIDNDRREMRALGAKRKTEEFKAPYNGTLRTDSEEFSKKLDGTETGDLELYMEARGNRGVTNSKFNSKKSADEMFVDDFGRDLMAGMELALAALREYIATKALGERAQE